MGGERGVLGDEGVKEVCVVGKKVMKVVKLEIGGGKGKGGAGVGGGLGEGGVNMMGLCKELNGRTSE